MILKKIALISVIFVPLSMRMFECMAVKVFSVIAYVYQILYIAVDVKNVTFKKSSLMSAVVLLGYTMAIVTAFLVCEMSVMNYPQIWETYNNLIFYMRILLIIVFQFLGPYFLVLCQDLKQIKMRIFHRKINICSLSCIYTII